MARRRSEVKCRMIPSLCIIFSLLYPKVDTSNILIFSDMGEGSHYSAASSLAEELYHRGHSISVLISSQFELLCKQPPHGDMFHFHVVHTNVSTERSFQLATEKAFEGRIAFREFDFLVTLGQDMFRQCEAVFNTTILKELQEAKFDLLICDPLWPCSVVLGEYLGVENVAMVPISVSSTIVTLLGGTTNPASIVQFGLGYPSYMTFFERLNNFVSSHLDVFMLSMFAELPYKHLFQEWNITEYMESLRKINLYLVASDPIFDQKIPVMPGHVQTAGLTIRKPKSLHQDLEDFLNSAGDNGVIIFSIGSYVNRLPEYFVTEFQEAFSSLPQKVIWQWKGNDTPENMPKNVKTMSWIPQMDLLGHKQIKLLFYLGGNNGIYEAIHFAVPVLVMPLMGDQLDVAQRVVESDIGLRIRVTEVTRERIVECITTILKDPKYRENVERLSAIFRDRPQTPRQRAAFMIEHVLKFGSEHLRSPSHDLNFIQLNLIDVYLFLILCFIFVLLILYFVSKWMFRLIYQCTFRNKAKRD